MKNKLQSLSILGSLLISTVAWSTAHIETTLKVTVKDLETSSDQKAISYLYEIGINDTSLQNKESPYQNTFPPFKGKFYEKKGLKKALPPIKLKLAANLAAPEITINLMREKNKDKTSVFHASCLLSQEQWDHMLEKLPEPAVIDVVFSTAKKYCEVQGNEKKNTLIKKTN